MRTQIVAAATLIALVATPAGGEPEAERLRLGYRIPDTPIVLDEPVRVYDADTFDVGAERIRVNNLDAPEIGGRADCPAESALGDAATTAAVAIFASAQRVTIYPEHRRDRYSRVLARVDVDGRDFAQMLIDRGLARPWRGRSSSWCPGG